jgi:hypothetical protein
VNSQLQHEVLERITLFEEGRIDSLHLGSRIIPIDGNGLFKGFKGHGSSKLKVTHSLRSHNPLDG